MFIRLIRKLIKNLKYHRKLQKTFREARIWNVEHGVRVIADLNFIIKNNGLQNLISDTEAWHQEQILKIANEIKKNKERIKLITIAGPSSSGKTTFEKRLSKELEKMDIKTINISLDNYFKDRQETPIDDYGMANFEDINALDLKLLNENLIQLLEGREIEIPKFNFRTGIREKNGERIKLKNGQIIMIEGLHGLNRKLTSAVPNHHKFKIYVSALTQLLQNNLKRISTTDSRLIRRLVRDYKFRAHTAEMTLKRWPLVIRGENRNIFPYQEKANVMFNSDLVYEKSVLKPIVMKLLLEIDKKNIYYNEAKRILNLLNQFETAPDEIISLIPKDSILREFIGGSEFEY